MSTWINTLLPFYGIFENPSFSTVFPSIWIGIIILLAVVAGIKFWESKRNCQKNIQYLIEVFRKYQPETLTDNFETLNEQLSQNAFIKHFWSEFTETLIRITILPLNVEEQR